jgi:hypothetical protein
VTSSPRDLRSVRAVGLALALLLPAAKVASATAFVQGKTASTSGTALVISYSTNVQLGDLLVAYVRTPGGTSVSDSVDGEWRQVAPSPDGNNSMWYFQNAKGGTTSVTVKASSNGSMRAVIGEYSGVATSNALDQAACSTGTSKSVNTGDTASIGRGELVFAGVGTIDQLVVTSGASNGKWATLRNGQSDNNGTSAAEDVLSSAGGQQNATFSLSGSGSGWAACVATFQPAPAHCDLYASTTGSDSNPGTYSSPFATVAHLVNSLAPGQVGCLFGGTYSQDVTSTSTGTAAAPVTVTSYPGELATIIGRLWIDGNYETWEHLALDGKNANNLPSPTVNGSYDIVRYDDIYDEHTGICIEPGSYDGQTATDATISHDLIHDCGALPPTNHDHCIYDSAIATHIANNLIYDCADRAVQLYPDSQDALINNNVIDNESQGVDFSGGPLTATSNATVENNLITNAGLNYCNDSGGCRGMYSIWGWPVGTGNVAENNCVYGGDRPWIDTSQGGFSSIGNLLEDPGYQDEASHNYNISSSSPCFALAGNVAGTGQGP